MCCCQTIKQAPPTHLPPGAAFSDAQERLHTVVDGSPADVVAPTTQPHKDLHAGYLKNKLFTCLHDSLHRRSHGGQCVYLPVDEGRPPAGFTDKVLEE